MLKSRRGDRMPTAGLPGSRGWVERQLQQYCSLDHTPSRVLEPYRQRAVDEPHSRSVHMYQPAWSGLEQSYRRLCCHRTPTADADDRHHFDPAVQYLTGASHFSGLRPSMGSWLKL